MMLHGKNAFLSFSLFLVFATIVSGRTGIAPHPAKSKNYQFQTIIKNASSGSNEEIAGIDGLLHSLIRVNETNYLGFEAFKNNKKDSRNNPFLKSIVFSNFVYPLRLHTRGNALNICPLYIAYQRLTI